MKLNNLMNLLVLGLALTITGAGCHNKKPLKPTILPGSANPRMNDQRLTDSPPVRPGDTGITDSTGGHAPNGPNHPGWTEMPEVLKAQTIYFDFDKASIKSSEHSKLEDVANYLKSHGEAALRVEGNCDERGTEEYNRSLGERRALAAREYLIHAGVDASRVDTISYGEDKPAEQGHSEAAWSKNRRDDFVVLNPPKP